MKKLLTALLSTALLLPLAACGGGNPSAQTTNADTADDVTTEKSADASTDTITNPVTEAATEAETDPETETPTTPPEEAAGFRVSAYITVDSVDSIDPGHLSNGITDVILIGDQPSYIAFDVRGNITLADRAVHAIARMKEYIGDRPIRLYCTLGGDFATAVAFRRTREDLIPNILSFLEEYELDGVNFDWEFPTNATEQRDYSTFLTALGEALGDRYTLSVALAHYCADLTPEAIAAIDRVEMMNYDIWDDENMHASLPLAIESVQKMLELGYRPEQINMGIPFYARPTTKEGYWYAYAGHYNQLDEKGLFYDERNGLTFSFNDYNIVYQKTAWAIENGLGGVMAFNYGCDLPADNELALFNAIGKAVADAGLK